ADDPALVQELLTLFGEELDGAVKAISRAIDRDDRETLRRAAHKLRGEAVTLDFRGLAQQLQVLESEAHTLETQQLAMLNAKLHKESRRSVSRSSRSIAREMAFTAPSSSSPNRVRSSWTRAGSSA
ncbi:Hpt domain-containing protein, partial [Enterobacter cloacae]